MSTSSYSVRSNNSSHGKAQPRRLLIFKIYNQIQCLVIKTYRSLLPIYGPSERYIHRFVEYVHSCCWDYSWRWAKLTIRRRAQQLGFCLPTAWKILRNDLGLTHYEIQLVQELKLNDHRLRRTDLKSARKRSFAYCKKDSLWGSKIDLRTSLRGSVICLYFLRGYWWLGTLLMKYGPKCSKKRS